MLLSLEEDILFDSKQVSLIGNSGGSLLALEIGENSELILRRRGCLKMLQTVLVERLVPSSVGFLHN